jgi:hypothetical protein
MISNHEFVSRVLNGLKGLTKDTRISRRYVLNIGKQKVTTYISQKLLERTIYREDNLAKVIPCVEMEAQDKISCPIVEFKRLDTLYRSKERIEGVVYSRFGSSVFLVESLDGNVIFNPATKRTVTNRVKRRFGSIDNVFYISDGYIYIPDEIEAINVHLITLTDKETEEVSTCNNCDKCKSVWDYSFICPDKILDPVVREVIQEVAVTYNIPTDENPNLDSNIKSTVR